MVENLGKWQEGPQQITRLVLDGPPQLMVENLGKWREGPHWFLRTTNKTASLGATKWVIPCQITQNPEPPTPFGLGLASFCHQMCKIH